MIHKNIECRAHKNSKNTWRAVEWIGAILIAAYTVVQAAQLLVVNDQERRQLRAYLNVTNIVLQCVTCAKNAGQSTPQLGSHESGDFVSIMVKNGGQTPASNASSYLNYKRISFDVPWPPGITFEDKPRKYKFVESAQMLLPQQERPLQTLVDGNEFSEAQKGNIRLIIYGHIDYLDIFADQQQSTFCAIYEPTSVDPGRSVNCPEHNGETPNPPHWWSRLLAAL